jgi:glucoamylase
MAVIRGDRHAFGRPGIPPRWTSGSKDGAGTAFSDASKIWFTLWKGILTEIYWPTVDAPQTRDLQCLITDGQTFFHEEKRDLDTSTELLDAQSLAYRIVNRDPEGRYTITKRIIADPLLPCVLQHTTVECQSELQDALRLYILFAPHMDRGGAHNEAFVMEQAGREILVAHRGESWCALGATIPFTKLSCGFVGKSDGWTDISQHLGMHWEFDKAVDGNVALTAEIQPSSWEFTLGIAFGNTLQSAIATLFQSLAFPFEERLTITLDEWKADAETPRKITKAASDKGKLFASSYAQLIAHEDKTFPGAFIASLSIPWGEAKGDEDLGGYHLVWTRDMVSSAMGMLAAGDRVAPLRALIYLSAIQHEDGGFPQNFWIDGEAYWKGIQLDEVALPILLARKLAHEEGLETFDPYIMVMRAASYLIVNGPATQEERWEEASGYSPSTLATNIAALIAAAGFADKRNDSETANYLREYADFLEGHLEEWTVTTQGTLVKDIPRHFIRILPIDVSDTQPVEDPDTATMVMNNQEPGARAEYPAKEIIDAGFLELVRYGIRRADDPLIVDSVKVVDAVLRIETPFGPGFYRYNHDGYGQRDDGGSYDKWGVGRLWPLLTGERGHYELAKEIISSDPNRLKKGPFLYLHALERFATKTGLLAEQVWDKKDGPAEWLKFGCPTGAAMPLMWAHAEYIRLLRSIHDGIVFDRVPEVEARYAASLEGKICTNIEIWKPNRQPRSIKRGRKLRLQAPEPFTVRWTLDHWETQHETKSISTRLGIEYTDIEIGNDQQVPIEFTFFWTERGEWEAQNHQIIIVD